MKTELIILCEESQEVTIQFRKKGINAFSCDIQDCSGGHPEWHIKGDALRVAKERKPGKVISFPPCTDLSLSGARWFEKKRLSGEQEASVNFFLDIWELSNCVENPKNIMTGWKYLKQWFPSIVERMNDIGFPVRYTQSVQPWQFGHGEVKETLFWLKGLPPLRPTRIVDGREPKCHGLGPCEDRGKIRSKTYRGIATAMANQWHKLI